jgi:phospholipid-transporting ATPase
MLLTTFVSPSRMEQFQKAIRKVRQVQRMRKQRGYAFSQTDESQARVLQAYDTTRVRGRYGEMASSREPGLLGSSTGLGIPRR